MINIQKRTFAELALIFDTLIWGLTFPFIRIVIAELSPIVLMFWRGTVSAIVFAFFVFAMKRNRKLVLELLPAGALIGLFFYIGYLTQAIGLQTIDSGRSAFITNLSVVFVPILSPFFKAGRPTKADIISSIVAFFGLFLLIDPVSRHGVYVGDFWTILTALSFSVQIHLVQIYMKKFKASGLISFVQVLFIGIFAALCLPFAEDHNVIRFLPTTANGYYSLLYLAGFATIITVWLQSRYQYETTPERAAVIYVLEPVFASIFGFMILHEKMSMLSLLGAFIMLFAVLWTYPLRLLKKRSR